MKILQIAVFTILILISAASPNSQADICFFGYTVNEVEKVSEIYDEYGFDPNIGVVFGKNPERLISTAKAFNDRGAKAIIMLQDLIFEKVPGSETDCSDYSKDSSITGPEGLKLYIDWKSRLISFIDSSREYLTSGNVIMLGIADEPNNNCLPNEDVDKVGNYIKSLDIGLPLAITYGVTSYDDNNKSNPLPKIFPETIDVFAIYNYAIFDPTDKDNPLNPVVTWGENWREIKQKLGSRKVILVINSYCVEYQFNKIGWIDGCLDDSIKTYASMMYAWREWALNEPTVIGIIPYSWAFYQSDESGVPLAYGVRDMHKSVQDAHRDIINSIHCDYNPNE